MPADEFARHLALNNIEHEEHEREQRIREQKEKLKRSTRGRSR